MTTQKYAVSKLGTPLPRGKGHISDEESVNYDGPAPAPSLTPKVRAPCDAVGSPNVPVIHQMTDYLQRDAYVVFCHRCKQEVSPPYLDLDAARAAAWEHSFPWAFSDLRGYQTIPTDDEDDDDQSNGHH